MQFLVLTDGEIKGVDLPPGFHLGSGVFETLRVRRCMFESGAERYGVLGLERHLRRLSQGCEFFRLDFPGLQNLTKALSEAFMLLHANRPGHDYLLRIVVFKESCYLTANVWQAVWQFSSPLKLKSVIAERPFPETKNCSAIVSQHAREIALRHDCHEALLLSHDGMVREAAWANIFWSDSDGILNTPRTGILPGVTRELILSLYPETRERDISLKELIVEAQEIFVCQATHGITPVAALDQTSFMREEFERTRNVLAHYESLLESREFVALN